MANVITKTKAKRKTNIKESSKSLRQVSGLDSSNSSLGLVPTNEVFLRGRVSSTSVERQLPSGDKVVEFRLVIGRTEISKGVGGSGKAHAKRKQVDTLDMAAWSYKSRMSALKLQADDWVEITGSVRRRFWQAPSGLASRWQVEVLQITRISA
jgi:single-strand DNA-binding protein